MIPNDILHQIFFELLGTTPSSSCLHLSESMINFWLQYRQTILIPAILNHQEFLYIYESIIPSFHIYTQMTQHSLLTFPLICHGKIKIKFPCIFTQLLTINPLCSPIPLSKRVYYIYFWQIIWYLFAYIFNIFFSF